MLVIRLQRTGKTNQPHFRVVVIEHTRKVGGKYHELLGSYNPRSKEVSLKKEQITHWLSKGVKPSPTVHNLLVKHGVIPGPKIQAWKAKKKEGAEIKTEAIVPPGKKVVESAGSTEDSTLTEAAPVITTNK